MTVFSSPTALAFTPHARGSTRPSEGQQQLRSVYPACAGIDPQIGLEYFVRQGLPRMRGDRPSGEGPEQEELAFTPHARGSTVYYFQNIFFLYVYPACAGIDPQRNRQEVGRGGLPRMRGDRPLPSKGSYYVG